MKNNSEYHSFSLTIKHNNGRNIDHVIRMKKTGYKRYFNSQHLFFQLSPLENSFFEYLIESSDNKSRVHLDMFFKVEYTIFMKKVLKKEDNKIQTARLNKVVCKLKELGLIIPCEDTRGIYYVNPKYAHKGSEKTRISNIKNVIHERLLKNLPINMLIDTPDEKLDAV